MNLTKKTLLFILAVLLLSSLMIMGAMQLYISFYFKLNPRQEFISGVWIAGAAAVISAVYGSAAGIFLFFIRRRVLGNINLLTKRADEIGGTCDFSSRLPVKTDDEISQLAWSFNALLDRMAESNYTLEKSAEETSSKLERSIKDHLFELMTMKQVLSLMEEVFEHSLEGVIITDSSRVITKVNPAFTKITGYTEQEAIGKTSDIIKSDYHNEHFYTNMHETLLKEGHWSGEIWHRHKDGNIFPEMLAISAIKNSEGEITNFIAIFHDISDIKRQEELIRFQAFHDPLTGLPNRFLLKNRIEQAILHSGREKNKFGVMFLDLDNFKKINESLGIDIGDLLIKAAAERIRTLARNIDTVARHGGDEFIILVESIENEKPLITLAQRILVGFKEPFSLLESRFHIGISIGIAIFPDDGEDYDILLRNADTAMYRAKEVGKETFTMYTVSLNERVSRNLTLENELRHALSEKEFEVWYQPQMDIKTGRIVGVEGLARWSNSHGVIMPPDGFIPFSEETGLIFEIDRIVMEKALVDIGGLINTGAYPLKLSLNCSAKVLHLKRLPNIINGYLSKYNFAPEWFELEITETSIMENYIDSIESIHKLRDTGISISLDDFGTGYSSLAQLKNLPINTIKIDRSFIEEINTGNGDAHIVEAVVSLSRKFGVTVIAEGVENEEQLAFLKNAGCDIAQGYYISRPVPFDKLKAFLGVE